MTKKHTTKSDLLNVLRLGIELHDTDSSVGKGAGRFASKVIDWDKFWSAAKQAVEQSH